MSERPGRFRRRASPRNRTIATAIVVVAVLAIGWLLLMPGRGSTDAVQTPPPSTSQSSSPSTSPLTVPMTTTTAPAATVATRPESPAAPSISMTPENATEALSALALLPVSDVPPVGDYLRESFGQAWSDDVEVEDGHNGCDTRNDILRRDLSALQLKPGTRDCVVLAGVLTDAYTGAVSLFQRGADTSDDVQIDHLVALSEAWRSGADRLTDDERRNLANDPVNLQATSGSVNQEKGDGDAADWLPPNEFYRCEYLARQIDVKTRYRLTVSTTERKVMIENLVRCGGVASTASAGYGTTAPSPPATRPRSTTPGSAEAVITAAPTDASSGRYANCKQAWAAGVAPLHIGQPGYREDMDGDRDGIACESPP